MKQKLLFVAGGSYISGLEIVTLHLIREMKAEGNDVLCLINKWSDGQFKQALVKMNVPFEEVKLGWLYLRKPLWTLDTLIHLPGAFLKSRAILRRFRPDVIHFCNYASVIMLYPLLKNNNCVYNLQEPHEPTGKNLNIYRILNKKIKIFTAVSKYIEKVLLDLKIPNDKIRIVFNGVPAIENIVHKEGPPDRLVFGIIGQVASWKGHDTLIEAVDRLKDLPLPSFAIRIFGNDKNPYGEHLKKKIKEKGLDHYFSWEGFITDQDMIYDAVDVVVVPSLSQEPCSLTILESMMRGKILIVSDRGGNPELINDRSLGLVFKADDPEKLADAIGIVLKKDPLTMKTGENAHQLALAAYTNNRMAGEYSRIYEEIA